MAEARMLIAPRSLEDRMEVHVAALCDPVRVSLKNRLGGARPRIDLTALASSAEAYRATGTLTEPFDLNTAVDHQFVDHARERLGPYRAP